MGLRETAENDLASILEDSVYGFGWDITLTDPAAVSKALVGYSNDIAQAIDPDTGQVVSGRVASVVLRLSTLAGLSLSIPEGIADSSLKPWLVAVKDINGNDFTFKVSESNPDRTLGIVVCHLELYAT